MKSRLTIIAFSGWKLKLKSCMRSGKKTQACQNIRSLVIFWSHFLIKSCFHYFSTFCYHAPHISHMAPWPFRLILDAGMSEHVWTRLILPQPESQGAIFLAFQLQRDVEACLQSCELRFNDSEKRQSDLFYRVKLLENELFSGILA